MCFKLLNNFIVFPLCPHEVIVCPLFKVAHRPPKPGFKAGPDQHGIVASAYEILIGREALLRKADLYAIRLVDLVQVLLIVPFFDLVVLLLVLGVVEGLGELLDLGCEEFKIKSGVVLSYRVVQFLIFSYSACVHDLPAL
jgi:hypothetical protein